MNVKVHPTVPQEDAAEQARYPAEAEEDAEGPKGDVEDLEGFPCQVEVRLREEKVMLSKHRASHHWEISRCWKRIQLIWWIL